VEVNESGEPRERYTDALYIQNLDMLEGVIGEDEKGWVVVDSFAWDSLPADTRDFIEKNLTYYEEGSSEGEQGDIMVYGW
jgi:hypothetical protein